MALLTGLLPLRSDHPESSPPPFISVAGGLKMSRKRKKEESNVDRLPTAPLNPRFMQLKHLYAALDVACAILSQVQNSVDGAHAIICRVFNRRVSVFNRCVHIYIYILCVCACVSS